MEPVEEGARVLLVEDTLDDALMIRTLLERDLGCTMSLAQDGIRGCQLAENQEWDLVITDLNLPGRGGAEVIETSRRTHPDTPVLAITAYAGEEHGAKAREEGIDALVEKPLDRDELLAAVRGLLASGRRGRQGSAPEGEEDAPRRSVLALAALPGDAILGCGGILLGHRDHGHEVCLLVFSAGGGEEGDAGARGREAERAAGILDAEVVLAEPFGTEIPSVERMVAEVESAVERFSPDTIYAPSAHDVRESRLGANEAARLAGADAPEHYCYQAATTTLEFRPTLFIDVTEYMALKLEALALFRGRPDFRPHLQPGIAEASARYWGRFLGYREVEPLEVSRSAL